MGYNHDMNMRLRKLLFVGELICAISSAVFGTIAAAQPNGHWSALLWWTISILSAFHMLSAKRSRGPAKSAESRREPSVVVRAAVASVAIFCLTILVALSLTFAAQQGPIAQVDLAIAIILSILGIGCLVLAFRMIWR